MEAKTSNEKKIKEIRFQLKGIKGITDLEEFEGFEFGDGFNAFDEEFIEKYSEQD